MRVVRLGGLPAGAIAGPAVGYQRGVLSKRGFQTAR